MSQRCEKKILLQPKQSITFGVFRFTNQKKTFGYPHKRLVLGKSLKIKAFHII